MLQRRRLRLARYPGWLALCVLPAIMSCDDDDTGDALPGELGNNHFFYGCSTIDDAHCREGLTGFPEKVAVGGSFDLHAKGDNGTSLSARPASPVMVTPVDGGFRFRDAGWGAFLAFEIFDEFVDFAHVQAVAVDDIRVEDSFGSAESELTLTSGQRTTITAVPLDEFGDTLAGSLVYRWATDNDAVLEVENVGTSVQVTALAVGTAQLRVSLADEVSRVVQVVVREGASGTRDAGASVIPRPSGDAAADAAMPDAGAVPDGGTTSTFDASMDAAATSPLLDAGGIAPIDAASGSDDTNIQGADAALDGGQ